MSLETQFHHVLTDLISYFAFMRSVPVLSMFLIKEQRNQSKVIVFVFQDGLGGWGEGMSRKITEKNPSN